MTVFLLVFGLQFILRSGMSWYKTNYYTEDPFRIHPLLLQLLVSEARYFRIMVVFSLSISTLFCFKKLSLSPN